MKVIPDTAVNRWRVPRVAADPVARKRIAFLERRSAELMRLLHRPPDEPSPGASRRAAQLQRAQLELVQHRRLEEDVLLAAEVQASLLPRETADLPGWEVAGVALAARYVSGDMYDWLTDGTDHWYVGLCDIAGKGVPAAMLTSGARALLRDWALRGYSPGRALARLNRSLLADLTSVGAFLTAVVARLDRRTAELEYASAGHPEVLWYRALTSDCARLPATVPPIGVCPELEDVHRRVILGAGDILVFYTDGITEAEDASGGLFGLSRLEDLVCRGASLAAPGLAQSIINSVDAFSDGRRSDDVTLVIVKAPPKPG